MPSGSPLYATKFVQAIQLMHQRNMYNKMVVYIESCESGSMFNNLLPKNINVYATSASSPDESSWGCYCPPEDVIDGTSVGSCLGDLYSVNWMEDADKQTPLGMKETLQEQFVVVRQLTTMSHVMQYGDLSWTNMTIGQFQGEVKRTEDVVGQVRREPAVAPNAAGVVNSRDIKLHSLYYAYVRADKTDLVASHAAAAELQKEIAHRVAHDNLFAGLAQTMVNENWAGVMSAPAVTPIVASECVNVVHKAVADFCGGFSDYSLQYARVVYNLCAMNRHSTSAAARMVHTVQSLCTA
jgi:legumain